jgi:phage terminase small subunit
MTASAKRPPAKREDWGQLGPAMRALPNDQWRRFALELVTGPGGHGKYTAAARAAGFGKGSKPSTLGKQAWQLAHDDRMIAAIAEEARKHLRGAHPEAVNALHNMIRDPQHRDPGRAVLSLLDRVDPVVSKQNIEVTHRVLDPDQEALEELQALRQLGVSREKMIETFGGNGLARLERLEAADIARRSTEAKVIDGELIEVSANG